MIPDRPVAAGSGPRRNARPSRTATGTDDRPARYSRSRRFVATSLTVLLWAGLLLTVSAVIFGRVEGYRLFAIRSGSMGPTLGVGDLIIDRETPADSLRPGQLVTFRDPDLGQQLVTHRVVSVEAKDRRLYFRTKGDANKTPEQWDVPAHSELGRTVGHVPKIGRLLLEPRRWLAAAAVLVLCLTAGYRFMALLVRSLSLAGATEDSSQRSRPRGAARHRVPRTRKGRRRTITASVILLLSALVIGGSQAAWTAADQQSASSFATTGSFSTFYVTGISTSNNGTAGKIDTGDSFTVTFHGLISIPSFCSSFPQSLPGSVAVNNNFNNNAGGTGNDTVTTTASACTLHYGTLDLGSNAYGTTTCSLASNVASITETATTSTVVISFNSVTGCTNSVVNSSALTFTADASLKDTGNNAVDTTPFTATAAKNF
jgi:signal peptidase